MIKACKIVFRIKYWPKLDNLYEKVKMQNYSKNKHQLNQKINQPK